MTTEVSAKLARKLSAESTVLLKNDNVLPIKPGQKIAVIGLADTDNALTHAGGSGEVTPSFIATPLSSIKAQLPGATITYDDGKDSAKVCYRPAPPPTPSQPYLSMRATAHGAFSALSAPQAAAAAKAADVAIVFVGTLSSEGSDRKSLSLDDGGPMSTQNALIEAVAAAQPESVVVLSVPGAILCPWSGKVKAILTNFMPGQQAGNAIADVLLGKVNPSGKLPLTFPNKEDEVEFAPDQWPGLPDPKNPTYANYTEELLVGYRYYDAHKIEFTTGYPFGHGSEPARALASRPTYSLPSACILDCCPPATAASD